MTNTILVWGEHTSKAGHPVTTSRGEDVDMNSDEQLACLDVMLRQRPSHYLIRVRKLVADALAELV